MTDRTPIPIHGARRACGPLIRPQKSSRYPRQADGRRKHGRDLRRRGGRVVRHLHRDRHSGDRPDQTGGESRQCVCRLVRPRASPQEPGSRQKECWNTETEGQHPDQPEQGRSFFVFGQRILEENQPNLRRSGERKDASEPEKYSGDRTAEAIRRYRQRLLTQLSPGRRGDRHAARDQPGVEREVPLHVPVSAGVLLANDDRGVRVRRVQRGTNRNSRREAITAKPQDAGSY